VAQRLRMPAQLGDWLAELSMSAPVAAAEAAAAVTAVMQAELPQTLPFVTDPDDPDGEDPPALLRRTYQDLLTRLQVLRRKAADATTTRKNAEQRLAEEQAVGGAESTALAALEELTARARTRERGLLAGSERLQRDAEVFSAHLEVVRALYVSAAAGRRIEEAAEAGVGWADGLGSSHGELSAAASDRTRVLLAQARRLRADIKAVLLTDDDAASQNDAPAREKWPADSAADRGLPPVLELRADPLGAGIRILFAIELPGTVTLLTVLEGETAVRASRDTAIELAGELLAEIRADDELGVTGPGSDEAGDIDARDTDAGHTDAGGIDAGDSDGWLEFADPAAFLAQYFPGSEPAIAERANALAAGSSLAGLRRQRGLSLADLARKSGLDEKWLRATEAGDLRAATVQDVAVYVRALGGSLDLAARFDGAARGLS
jgi:hypothetical protein